VKLEENTMSTDTLVDRPATPHLDLLNTLTEQVFYPVGHQKLASYNQVASNVDELAHALAIGNQVRQAIEVKQASRQTPLEAHADKVAHILGIAPQFSLVEKSAAVTQAISQQIDSDPAVAAQFDAVLA